MHSKEDSGQRLYKKDSTWKTAENSLVLVSECIKKTYCKKNIYFIMPPN